MTAHAHWRASLGVAMAILVASGCSGEGLSGAPTSAPTNPSSAPTISSSHSVELEVYAGDGFEMLLPSKWTVVTPSEMDFGSMLEGSGEILDSEALEQQVTAVFRQGGRLFAFDVLNAHPDPGFVDNINIMELPLPGLSVKAGKSIIVQQFEDVLGARVIESEIRTVPAGEAVVVYYRLPNPGNEGISVALLTESTQWVITLSAMDVGPLEADFEAMIDSFRQTP